MKKITSESKNQALKILNRDKILNYAMINLLKNNKISEIEIHKNCVAIKQNRSEGWVHLSANTLTELREFLPLIENEKYFAATNTDFIDIITGKKKVVWREDCYRLAYLNNNKFKTFSYPAISLSDAEIVNNFWPYKSEYSLEYVKSRIKNGLSVGYFAENKLVSWIITQDDGAMGFFHTLKEYRRRGYGEKITKSLINKLIENQKIPFVYVIIKNENSLSLTRKLNFKITGKVSWFELS